MTTDADWLGRALALATRNVSEGGGPFGALVVGADGGILAEGVNRVTPDNDPTAHAEVTAIRRACATIGDFSLAGATLYTSCEPCPMCLASALWSRVSRIVFAADRHDAERAGFDDRAFYSVFETPSTTWRSPSVEELRVDAANAPFEAWLAAADRTEY